MRTKEKGRGMRADSNLRNVMSGVEVKTNKQKNPLSLRDRKEKE